MDLVTCWLPSQPCPARSTAGRVPRWPAPLSGLSRSFCSAQRGSKRHSTAPVVSQAYAGAAVARTATGQFAPALNNAHKRRRTDAPQDADYPGLPVGMTRPSLQVGESRVAWC